LALQTSDRAHFVARWCGRRAGGLVPPVGEPGRAWKRSVESITATPRGEQHTVVRYLALVDALGLPRETTVVPPGRSEVTMPDSLTAVLGHAGGYAVIHPTPMYPYKAWTADGWRAVIAELGRRGLRVCVSGGPAAAERNRVRALLAGMPDAAALDICGQLEFAALANLLAGARLFAGTDTSVTHLAAACGTPTIALFGPSDPVTWGPWPASGAAASESPWRRTTPLQSRGNVTVVQGSHARFPNCIPCLKDGCENRPDSPSDCLDRLQPATVIAAIDAALRAR
jgi:heptosyltransferase-3